MNIKGYPIPETCPYCGAGVVFTSNAEIYGREYGNGKCYKCTDCDAYVGIHTGTRTPLGRLADKELRALKVKCHDLFDPSWQQSNLKRYHAYGKLAKLLGIPRDECHFGWFDKEMLQRAIEILRNRDWHKGVAP